MNYGLYLSASGVLTNMYRQDVFSNNLSNAHTAAFKPHVPTIKARDPERIEGGFGGDVSQRLLERLGGGSLAGRQRIDFAQAELEQTGNPLDAALERPGEFFAVRVGDEVQLTRDGRFVTNAAGELVTVAGHRVLDADDEPIVLPGGGEARLDGAGRVYSEGEPVAQLQVARVADMDGLEKRSGNRFAFANGDAREVVAQPMVRAGYVETSGVNPITTLTRLIDASKAVAGNAEMIRYQDAMMEQAVNTLGRVA